MKADALDWQCRLNRDSFTLWESFGAHRAMVTNLALSLRGDGPGNLVVLGAGNCNDLDLARLCQGFDKISLIDIDEAAMLAGLRKQRISGSGGIEVHGGIDVTDPLPRSVAALRNSADVVVSAALLTQLFDTALRAGGTQEQLPRIRDEHLRLMASLLAPGGSGLVVIDVVSSDTSPGLRSATTPHDLASLLVSTVQEGNFFTGANPFAIERRISEDASVGSARVGITRPWRWELGARAYLVCAVAFQKARRSPG